jgi:hypothetical protein
VRERQSTHVSYKVTVADHLEPGRRAAGRNKRSTSVKKESNKAERVATIDRHRHVISHPNEI